MAKSNDEKKRDEALKRALAMPPTPHKPLGKKVEKKATAKRQVVKADSPSGGASA